MTNTPTQNAQIPAAKGETGSLRQSPLPNEISQMSPAG